MESRVGGGAWIHAVSLAALALAAPVGPDVAQAAAPATVEATRRAFTTAEQSFEIPASNLAEALQQWSATTKLKLFVPTDLVEVHRTEGLSGSFTPEAALKKLLAGTPLNFDIAGPHMVALFDPAALGARAQATQLPDVRVTQRRARRREAPKRVAAPPPPPPPPVVAPRETAVGPVQGYVATRSASGTKTDTPLIETPQSISIVTRDQLDAQQSYSAKEALRYSAGVVPESRGNFGAYDIIYNRGFIVDRYLDGMRLQGNTGFVTPQVELYGMERVELLRGPASVLFGQGSPGGLVNMVSRRPTPTPGGEVLLQTGNYGRVQGAFDVGGPIDAQGEFLYRLTGLGRYSENQVDFVKEERFFIAPAFTWRPNSDTTFTILTNYQRDPKGGLYNFVPSIGSVLFNPNGKIPTSFYAGDPSFNRIDRTQYSAGYLFEHRFDEVWTVRQSLRYLNATGHLDQVLPYQLESDDFTLQRYTQADHERIGTFTMDNQAQAKFTTGPLQHTLLMGLDYQQTTFKQNQVRTSPPRSTSSIRNTTCRSRRRRLLP